MPRPKYNLITEGILHKIHGANIGYGTPLGTLAKTYGVSEDKMRKALREWRKKYNKPTHVTTKEMNEAADRIAPVDMPFKDFNY